MVMSSSSAHVVHQPLPPLPWHETNSQALNCQQSHSLYQSHSIGQEYITIGETLKDKIMIPIFKKMNLKSKMSAVPFSLSITLLAVLGKSTSQFNIKH